MIKSRTYPGKSEEVRIRVRTTLRTVDLVEVFKRELQPRRELLDTCAELAFWKRREFVEKRLNYCWVEDNHRNLEDKPENT